MNALTQYLDLYLSSRGMIEEHSAAALNGHREGAYATLRRLGRFPEKGDETYEQVSVNEMFAPDYGLNLSRVAFPVDAEQAYRCDVPNVGALTALIVNDTFVATPSLGHMPHGVEVMSLAEAAERYPEDFGSDLSPKDNAVAAVNSLFVQDGVYVRLRRGTRLDKPIQVLSLFATDKPTMGVRRVRVHIEEGASGTVMVCDHPRNGAEAHLSCITYELQIGSGGSLEFYDLEETGTLYNRAAVCSVYQQSGSRLNLVSISLSGGKSRNEYHVHHLGERCDTRLNGMVVAGRGQIADNATFVAHDHDYGTSNQLFKYALFDNAVGGFEGIVTVAENARFTDANQSNLNLLVSPEARMHAMPQLIINCDEVKASHGSATGQLDENALFYMRSRGIDESEARMMLISAFMTEVLDAIAHKPVRDRLCHLVNMRLRGCAGCMSCSLNEKRYG